MLTTFGGWLPTHPVAVEGSLRPAGGDAVPDLVGTFLPFQHGIEEGLEHLGTVGVPEHLDASDNVGTVTDAHDFLPVHAGGIGAVGREVAPATGCLTDEERGNVPVIIPGARPLHQPKLEIFADVLPAGVVVDAGTLSQFPVGIVFFPVSLGLASAGVEFDADARGQVDVGGEDKRGFEGRHFELHGS